MLLVTMLAALVSTAVVAAVWYVAVTAPPTASAATRVNVSLAVAIAGASWASVIFTFCRDMMLRRVEELSEQLRETESRLVAHFSRTAAELAEQAEETGVFRGMELETRRPRPGPRSEGGQVIRHPRLAEAPTQERP